MKRHRCRTLSLRAIAICLKPADEYAARVHFLNLERDGNLAVRENGAVIEFTHLSSSHSPAHYFPSRASSNSLRASRSFSFAFLMARDIMGPATLEKPAGVPEFLRVILVRLFPSFSQV